jgi:hypothetical protein
MNLKKGIRNILIAVGLMALLIGAYQCGSRGKEQSMRAYKKEQQEKLDSIQIIVGGQETIISVQNRVIEKSMLRDSTNKAEISVLKQQQAQGEERFRRERDNVLSRLETAGDEQIASHMDSSYRVQVLDGDFLTILDGNVTTATAVSLHYIRVEEFNKFLTSENKNLADQVGTWELRGNEFEIQRTAWGSKENAYMVIIEQKDEEIGIRIAGQKFMEGKARKYRRQRNGLAVLGVVVLGGITYLVVK